MLHLIIKGRWKTPSHSSDRSKDDSHAVKKQILKAVGKRIYGREVGNNPDIDVDSNSETIILKGRGEFSKKNFDTQIDANEFFKLLYLNINNVSKFKLLDLFEFENVFVIPPCLKTLDSLLKHMIDTNKFESFVIVIRL